MKSLVFVSLFTQSPSFLMTNPAVEALMTRVKIEHPAILKRQMKVNFLFSAASAAKIKVKAIPTAPLKPP